MKRFGDAPTRPSFLMQNRPDLNDWMSKFTLEICRMDRKAIYTKYIVCNYMWNCMQLHLEFYVALGKIVQISTYGKIMSLMASGRRQIPK